MIKAAVRLVVVGSLLLGALPGVAQETAITETDAVEIDSGIDLRFVDLALQVANPAAWGPGSGPGYNQLQNLPIATFNRWEIVLVDSPGIELVRPKAQDTADQLSLLTHADWSVRPGVMSYEGPNPGDIDQEYLTEPGTLQMRVADDHYGSFECGGSTGWVGCGGPSSVAFEYPYDAVISAGLITVKPGWPGASLGNIVTHEVGHVVGLGHFEPDYLGETQVMYPQVGGGSVYRQGDINGIVNQADVPDLDEIIMHDPSNGDTRLLWPDGTYWYDREVVFETPVLGSDVVSGVYLGGSNDDDLLMYDAETGSFQFLEVGYSGYRAGSVGQVSEMTTFVSTFGSRGWSHVVTGDYNGDGVSDLLFYRSADGLMRFYTTSSSGAFTPITPVLYGSRGWTHMVPGDYNGDGRDDVLWYRATDGVMRFYEIRDGGIFAAMTPAMYGNTGWDQIPSGDFDADGSDDVFYYRDDGLGRFYTINGSGAFSALGPVLHPEGGWSDIQAGQFSVEAGEELFWFRALDNSFYATQFVAGELSVVVTQDSYPSSNFRPAVGDFD